MAKLNKNKLCPGGWYWQENIDAIVSDGGTFFAAPNDDDDELWEVARYEGGGHVVTCDTEALSTLWRYTDEDEWAMWITRYGRQAGYNVKNS